MDFGFGCLVGFFFPPPAYLLGQENVKCSKQRCVCRQKSWRLLWLLTPKIFPCLRTTLRAGAGRLWLKQKAVLIVNWNSISVPCLSIHAEENTELIFEASSLVSYPHPCPVPSLFPKYVIASGKSIILQQQKSLPWIEILNIYFVYC